MKSFDLHLRIRYLSPSEQKKVGKNENESNDTITYAGDCRLFFRQFWGG